MRLYVAIALLALLAGCAPRLTDEQVEQDFRRLMEAEYKALKLQKVHRVAFGDGWGDGAEFTVHFDGKCTVRGADAAGIGPCTEGPMRMAMSYQLSPQGDWVVFSSRISGPELPSVALPPPPDVGDIAAFQGCKAVPRRALSPTELCQIDVLRKRCLPADDCFVTCISSPDARRLGGGCAHACLSYLHKSWSEPKGYADCGPDQRGADNTGSVLPSRAPVDNSPERYP